MMNRYEKTNQILENGRRKVVADRSVTPKVGEALDCVQNNIFASKLNVQWLHEECQINDKHFSARFARYTGFKPKSYILHHRIATGKRLLKETDETITMIAILLGFHSLSSFDKTFEDRTGIPPECVAKTS